MTRSNLDIKFNNKQWPGVLFKSDENPDKIYVFVHGVNNYQIATDAIAEGIGEDGWVLGFTQRGQGDNVLKPTKNPNDYIDDLVDIIEWVRNDLAPSKKVILIGESTGAGIICSFLEKHSSMVDSFIVWNMPYEYKYNIKGKLKPRFNNVMKLMIARLFSVNSISKDTQNYNRLSRNDIFKKMKLGNKNINTKTKIALHSSFRKGWKFLLRSNGKAPINGVYLQSEMDSLRSKNVDKLIERIGLYSTIEVQIIKDGYHILSLEPNNSELFAKIIMQSNQVERKDFEIE